MILIRARAHARFGHQIVRRVGEEHHLVDMPLVERLLEEVLHRRVLFEVVIAHVEKVLGRFVILGDKEALRTPVGVEPVVAVRHLVVKNAVLGASADVVAEDVELQPAVAVEHLDRLLSFGGVFRLAQFLIYPCRRRAESAQRLLLGIEIDIDAQRRVCGDRIYRQRQDRDDREDGDDYADDLAYSARPLGGKERLDPAQKRRLGGGLRIGVFCFHVHNSLSGIRPFVDLIII